VKIVFLKFLKSLMAETPGGGEIFVDGGFYGSTPSDITVPIGQHVIRGTLGGRECSRAIEITSGEISIHAEMVF